MHVLYLQQLLVLPGSPGNNRCWQFAQQWVAAGHRVTFVASDAALPEDHPLKGLASDQQPFLWEGVELYLIPVAYDHMMPFRKRLRSFARFYRQARSLIAGLDQQTYDAVLAYTAPLSVGMLGRRVAKEWQKPFFLEIADVWPDVPLGMNIIRGKPLTRWLKKRTQDMYAAATAIFPYSEGMSQLLIDQGVPAEKICCIPNGADLRQIHFSPRNADQRNGVHILYTGTIGLANDLGQVMAVMHRLQEQGRDDIHLTVVGWGNDGDRVRAMAQELDLRQVHFRPQVPREEAIQLLADADIGLVSFAPVPVLETNAATKFFDYLAAGLPMVLNYWGWQGEYLLKHKCGFGAPQGNLPAVVQNILYLADSPDLRASYGLAGRLLAEKAFDREQLAIRMLQHMAAHLGNKQDRTQGS